MGKKKPTLKQLQNTASDLNNYMNMISSGKYKNPIEINDNIKHLSDEIVQMVSVEIYKQDKNHLSKGSIAVIELLGLRFGDLKDNPELDKGEDTSNGKKKPEKKIEKAINKKPIIEIKNSEKEKKPDKIIEKTKKNQLTRAEAFALALKDTVNNPQPIKNIINVTIQIYVENGGNETTTLKSVSWTLSNFMSPLLALGIVIKDSNEYSLREGIIE